MEAPAGGLGGARGHVVQVRGSGPPENHPVVAALSEGVPRIFALLINQHMPSLALLNNYPSGFLGESWKSVQAASEDKGKWGVSIRRRRSHPWGAFRAQECPWPCARGQQDDETRDGTGLGLQATGGHWLVLPKVCAACTQLWKSWGPRAHSKGTVSQQAARNPDCQRPQFPGPLGG